MADDAQMVQGWRQVVDAAYERLLNTGSVAGQPVPSVFGKAKPGDPDLQRQRDEADQAQRARDYVQSTGELPPEEEIPPLFGGWGSRRG